MRRLKEAVSDDNYGQRKVLICWTCVFNSGFIFWMWIADDALDTDNQLDILKNGLDFSIRHARLNKTHVLTSFEMIHQTMKLNLRNYDQAPNLKAEIAHLEQNYVSSYKPTSTDLKLHRILWNIRNNISRNHCSKTRQGEWCSHYGFQGT